MKTCANGGKWHPWGCGPNVKTPCRGCQASTRRAVRDFHMAVLLGEYDIEGYTPSERAAQRQRARERAVSA